MNKNIYLLVGILFGLFLMNNVFAIDEGLIEKAVFKDDAFIHISTTGGSDIGCAVALKMLEIQSNPEFLNHVKEMGIIFGKGLKDIVEEYSDILKEVRGRGLMWGLEFNDKEDCQLSMLTIIKKGVLLNYCGNKKDTLIIMPPLIVQKGEIEEILLRIRQGLAQLKKIKK